MERATTSREARRHEPRRVAEIVHRKVLALVRTTATNAARCRNNERRQAVAQSRRNAVPASRFSPTGSTLRANPFPEVTDPICRLPLPTLFYRLEAVHLGDLLRIWVRAGVKTLPSNSPSDFQGPTKAHRTPREPRCFWATTSLSPAGPIPGSPCLTKKRQLFPGLSLTSPSRFALPHSPRRRRLATPHARGNFHDRVREY